MVMILRRRSVRAARAAARGDDHLRLFGGPGEVEASIASRTPGMVFTPCPVYSPGA